MYKTLGIPEMSEKWMTHNYKDWQTFWCVLNRRCDKAN